MGRPGLTIAVDNSDDENNDKSPPISSPMGKYYSEELRMTTQPFIRSPFDTIKKTIDIINILNSGISIKNIGKGTRSAAQLIQLQNGARFILRKTLINNKKIRDDLINEQLMYMILESDPQYINYISNLLYADIPLIHHKSEAYNYAYFVFAYQDGETLDRYIESNKGTMSFEDVMPLITNISKALEFLSSKGIVHRDIKPENIFINFTDGIKPLIFDFDISCRIGIDCVAKEFVGTRKYMTNSAKVILNVGDKLSFESYEYTKFYDLHSVAVLIEEDLVKIVKSADKEELITYAKHLRSQFKMRGGIRMRYNKTRKGGRIGIMNPSFGGKRNPENASTALLNLSETMTGGQCPCSANVVKQMMALPPGTTLGPITANLMKGGACGCQVVHRLPTALSGGYRATTRDLKYLKLWKKGKSIGYTMRSSLKAKGLIPRANGTKRVSKKYK